MKLLNKLFALLAILAISVSCDQITGDYLQNPDIDIDTTTVIQKFLLEEYTGYNCGSCPAAHEVAHQIEAVYKGRVIVLSVHAGDFAIPNQSYPYDFRTAIGNTYNDFFGNSKAGNPNGMINRRKFNNSYITRHNRWASLISENLEQEPALDLKLQTSYNEQTRKISANIALRYLKASSSEDYLCVLIAESGIIKYQKDYRKNPQDIPEYEHNHVLREGMTSAWGERISQSAIATGAKFDRNFNFTIPAGKDWVPENLSIIAFVYSKDKEYEILQVDSKYLFPKD